MTKEEYIKKWSGKCLGCECLMFSPTTMFPKSPYFVVCLWCKNRMKNMDGNPSVEEMIGHMILDEKNIWKGCPDYFDRIIDLYSVENASDDA